MSRKLSVNDAMKLTELKETLNELGCEDTIILENPSYETAILGMTEDKVLIYDYDKMAEYLVETDGMELNEAYEFIDYNTLRALPYMGVKHPIINFKFE